MLYRHYLDDYAAALRRDHMARWEAGADDQKTEDQALGRINTLTEIIDLEFAHIALFYEEPPKEDQELVDSTAQSA